ncbi:hypothetical protein J8M20_14085 [Pseudoalteromonas luteoviolacea]|uniref:hypothetical protein n=1 Tax=Pseudoalteromonas luteoviolacea TaxID=43657 RepID=UPI001B386359|nr:hypothetical protein [Pseudoalteromonas luteoviolacea]MBQ4812482.1 hypothetical protein [Pseudoalteromonas luteoviolacea]
MLAIVLLGWGVIAGSTLLFWWYSIEFAPTEEIRLNLAKKDGAPKVVGTLFGWVFALIIYGFMEFIRGVLKIFYNYLK